MPLLQRFDPPAYLDDFDGIPGQRDSWHEYVSLTFDSVIESERSVVTANGGENFGMVQYFNASSYDPGGPLVEQAIVWNAFPKELLRRFGRQRALIEADRLWPLSAYSGHYDPDRPEFTTPPASDTVLFRPLDEYCEWHVKRDPLTGNILRVTFTSEPPEYWFALFGGSMQIDDRRSVTFPGSKDRLLELYRELVDPAVVLDDLIVQKDFRGGDGELYAKGTYNPYNKWNTSHGIVHLCAPPNSLGAEIKLGGDATVLYRDGRGQPLTQPDALICGAAYGGPNRNSDPTIGASVNALARLGAMVTIANPVGLYMDHIDTNGWELPDGISSSDCVRVVRGGSRMIERMVVEVPPETRRSLSDLRIGGVPVLYGGQIGECITVKLVGVAAPAANVNGNDLVPAMMRGFVSEQQPAEIWGPHAADDPVRSGLIPAFREFDTPQSTDLGKRPTPRPASKTLASAKAVKLARPGRARGGLPR